MKLRARRIVMEVGTSSGKARESERSGRPEEDSESRIEATSSWC